MSSRSSVALAAALFALARPSRADVPPGAPDLRHLYGDADGTLSPGYPERHATSTAPPLEVSEPAAHVPHVALLFNPALAPLGKWSARLELAPLPAHALFFEASIVKFDIDLPDGSTTIRGHSFDFGYHLFPIGRGLAGFYIGPRVFFGSGSTDEATGTLFGYGGDLGYQWVLGPVAINLGIGAAYAKVRVKASAGVIGSLGGDLSQADLDALNQTVTESLVIPVATTGVGLAF